MDKIVEKITRLITLTQDNTIKWNASSPETARIIQDDDSYAVGAIYTTTYKEKRLRIYKRRFKVNEPSALVSGSSASLLSVYSPKQSYPYWDTNIILEFVNEEGDSLWTFPYAPSLEDLFSAVQYQVADVGNFLDSI
jgi:hypothetical protein